MKKEKINFKPGTLLQKLTAVLGKVRRYSLFIFIGFIVIVYGFVLMRIHSLSAAEPSNDAVSSQIKAARIPHIDQSVVEQLQSLQDNSVSVRALFNQARSNPFH